MIIAASTQRRCAAPKSTQTQYLYIPLSYSHCRLLWHRVEEYTPKNFTPRSCGSRYLYRATNPYLEPPWSHAYLVCRASPIILRLDRVVDPIFWGSILVSDDPKWPFRGLPRQPLGGKHGRDVGQAGLKCRKGGTSPRTSPQHRQELYSTGGWHDTTP